MTISTETARDKDWAKWPVEDRFGFAYLALKDKRLVGKIESAKHRESISAVHETLLSRPVDVEGLARKVGVKYEYAHLPAQVYGSLQNEGNGYVIRVRRHDSHQRQRFTLAHELAHFFLHAKGGLDGGLNLEEDVFLRSDATSHRQEWQANALAAHILMPVSKILQMLLDQPRVSVMQAARIFDVSVPAMQVRLGLPIG